MSLQQIQRSKEEEYEVFKEDLRLGQAEWNLLVNSAFMIPPGHAFVDDFPVWDGRLNPDIHRWNLRDKNQKILTTVSARLANLKTLSGQKISVALVGAVASLPGHHGKGLATQCFSEAMEWIETQSGADVVILWGSEISFYSRFGFHLMGTQYQIPLDAIQSAPGKVQGTIELGWNEKIFEKMKTRSCGIEFSEADYVWMSAHKNVLWCSLVSDGEVKAYTAIGRGIDLPNMVHEWGGYPCSLRALLCSIREKIPALTLIGPEKMILDFDLVSTLENQKPEKLCLARVLNTEKIKDFDSLGAWFWGLDGA